jgi:hypothetical protein
VQAASDTQRKVLATATLIDSAADRVSDRRQPMTPAKLRPRPTVAVDNPRPRVCTKTSRVAWAAFGRLAIGPGLLTAVCLVGGALRSVTVGGNVAFVGCGHLDLSPVA